MGGIDYPTLSLVLLPLRAGGGWEGVVRRASAELAAMRPRYPSPTLPCKQERE